MGRLVRGSAAGDFPGLIARQLRRHVPPTPPGKVGLPAEVGLESCGHLDVDRFCFVKCGCFIPSGTEVRHSQC